MQLHKHIHIIYYIIYSTSVGGVFGHWLPFLVNHPLCVAMVSSDEQNTASCLTGSLYLTNNLVWGTEEGGREERGGEKEERRRI